AIGADLSLAVAEQYDRTHILGRPRPDVVRQIVVDPVDLVGGGIDGNQLPFHDGPLGVGRLLARGGVLLQALGEGLELHLAKQVTNAEESADTAENAEDQAEDEDSDDSGSTHGGISKGGWGLARTATEQHIACAGEMPVSARVTGGGCPQSR